MGRLIEAKGRTTMQSTGRKILLQNFENFGGVRAVRRRRLSQPLSSRIKLLLTQKQYEY